MNKKHLEQLLYSAGGVAALVVILIAANFIISSLNLRADLTQGSVYTLSPGSPPSSACSSIGATAWRWARSLPI